MSSSPPWSSQVSWVTGVCWSSAPRSSLRMLWLYFDGSYFTVRALLPFWHRSCRTGRTRPNLLTTQSWNQSTQRTSQQLHPHTRRCVSHTNEYCKYGWGPYLSRCEKHYAACISDQPLYDQASHGCHFRCDFFLTFKYQKLFQLKMINCLVWFPPDLMSTHTHTHTSWLKQEAVNDETMWPCVLVFQSLAPQPSCWSFPRRLCSEMPASSVACPQLQAEVAALLPPAAPQPVWDTNTTNSAPTQIRIIIDYQRWNISSDTVKSFSFLKNHWNQFDCEVSCTCTWKAIYW